MRVGFGTALKISSVDQSHRPVGGAAHLSEAPGVFL